MTQKDIIANAAKQYMDSQHWRYEVRTDDDTRFVASFNMGLQCKLKGVRVLVICSATELQSIAVCPLSADDDTKATVAEYITRANYGLKIGKFEMDYDDGEVRYQACMSLKNTDPDLADVERTVDVPFLMMDRYGDGLAKAIMGFGNPKADIEAAEAD